nr:GNAT family N-acetyltransferase [Hasllibacter sp. MH4015]
MRRAGPEDADAVAALVDAAYRPWIDVMGMTPGPMLDDYAARIAQDWVGLRDDAQGLAEVMVLIETDDALLLDNLAIRPDLQGQGRGKGLLDVAEAVARDRGFTRLRLYAHEKMAANIAFYSRHGFAITHRVTEHGLRRVYMEKPLTP